MAEIISQPVSIYIVKKWGLFIYLSTYVSFIYLFVYRCAPKTPPQRYTYGHLTVFNENSATELCVGSDDRIGKIDIVNGNKRKFVIYNLTFLCNVYFARTR